GYLLERSRSQLVRVTVRRHLEGVVRRGVGIGRETVRADHDDGMGSLDGHGTSQDLDGACWRQLVLQRVSHWPRCVRNTVELLRRVCGPDPGQRSLTAACSTPMSRCSPGPLTRLHTTRI